MNCIKDKTIKTKQKIAKEIKAYQVQVKTALENLKNNGTITSIEYEALIETFANVEQYLRKKDMEVDKVVEDMGDENYIPWSERVREEARAQGRNEARAELEEKLAEKDEKLAEKDEKLAEQYERIRELEMQLAELKR
jgi:aminopeptidase N